MSKTLKPLFTVMMTFGFKLYRSDRNDKYLQATLEEACHAWNHIIDLQKRYYRTYHGYISRFRMIKHMTKVWHRHTIGSQSLEEIVERSDKAYQRFFDYLKKRKSDKTVRKVRPPKYKHVSRFTSFTFKQHAGYKLIDGTNRVVVSFGPHKKDRKVFKYAKSREIKGTVKTVRFKRNRVNEWFMFVATDATCEKNPKYYGKSRKGASVGIDFGLKTYLTLSDGSKVQNPHPLKKSLSKLRLASRQLKRKERDSKNRERARLVLARIHKKVSNVRSEFQWKLAHELCRKYDIICIEDLNLTGMCRRWGRKMGDLGHAEFIEKLKHVAYKYGVTVTKIDRFYPSSKTCSSCGHVMKEMPLNVREWTCPECGARHDRDLNAAKNILRRGISASVSECKTTDANASVAVVLEPGIPCL